VSSRSGTAICAWVQTVRYPHQVRVVRFSFQDTTRAWGVIDNDDVRSVQGSILGDWYPGPVVAPLNAVVLHAPCVPNKVICVAINFEGIDGFSPDMEEPLIFVKPGTAVSDPLAVTCNPFPGTRWWGEAELGVVIGKSTRNVSPNRVRDNVLGLTIGNDVTVENCDGRDHHLLRSKGADGFCPLGPWIETEIPEGPLTIEAYQDGELIRRGTTDQQFWQWPTIISRISQWMTLEPFDVVLTGNAPDIAGMRYLTDGAQFDAVVSHVGVLTTHFSSVPQPMGALE
jgi:2-keto-4-pentenoate hydratase/2-oxohepta-3-ene-1,7-dioic acid hydratase in catechol pathway